MLKTLKRLLARVFKSTKHSAILSYELVERETDDGGFRQAIRLLKDPYRGIVVELGPKVSVREMDDGRLGVSFTFDVVTNPDNLPYERETLTQAIGDCIIDIIEKDYK